MASALEMLLGKIGGGATAQNVITQVYVSFCFACRLCLPPEYFTLRGYLQASYLPASQLYKSKRRSRIPRLGLYSA